MNNIQGNRRAAKKAFTLIELLVVIAIICLLSAILFPVFVTVRRKARESSCASNLKQLGLAVLQYTQDYDEHWPMAYVSSQWSSGDTKVYPERTLVVTLEPYVKNHQIWNCPDRLGLDRGSSKYRAAWFYTSNKTNKTDADYGYNERVFGGDIYGKAVSVPVSAIGSPASQIMLGDMMVAVGPNGDVRNVNSPDFNNTSSWFDGSGGFDPNAPVYWGHRANIPRLYFPTTAVTSASFSGTQQTHTTAFEAPMLAPRHTNYSANVLYGDGHVKLRNVHEVYSHGCGNPLSEWCNGK